MEVENSLGLTLPRILALRSKTIDEDQAALRKKRWGIWNNISWKNYYSQVKNAAFGLESLGFSTGQTIYILSDNCPESFYISLASNCLGGTSVFLNPSWEAQKVESILDEFSPQYLFIDTQEQLDKILSKPGELGKTLKVVTLQKGIFCSSKIDSEKLIEFKKLLQHGIKQEQVSDTTFRERLRNRELEETCLGVIEEDDNKDNTIHWLTHHQLIEWGLQFSEHYKVSFGDDYFSFTSCAFLDEFLLSIVLPLLRSSCVNFPETIKTTLNDLREISPHYIVASPKVWSHWHSTLINLIENAGLFQKKNLQFLLNSHEEKNGYKPGWLKEKLFIAPLRKKLGLARAIHIFTTGPLPVQTEEFFKKIGIILSTIPKQTIE